MADHQKSAWRRAKANKQHDENFITKGLWGVSRHPKYVQTLLPCPLYSSVWLHHIDRLAVTWVKWACGPGFGYLPAGPSGPRSSLGARGWLRVRALF